MGKAKSSEDNDNYAYGNVSIVKEDKSLYEKIEKIEKSVKTEKKLTPLYNEKSGMVKLTFKGNRKKELRIGGDNYEFIGPSSLIVPRSVIESPDFENQKKYFLVREV